MSSATAVVVVGGQEASGGHLDVVGSALYLAGPSRFRIVAQLLSPMVFLLCARGSLRALCALLMRSCDSRSAQSAKKRFGDWRVSQATAEETVLHAVDAAASNSGILIPEPGMYLCSFTRVLDRLRM